MDLFEYCTVKPAIFSNVISKDEVRFTPAINWSRTVLDQLLVADEGNKKNHLNKVEAAALVGASRVEHNSDRSWILTITSIQTYCTGIPRFVGMLQWINIGSLVCILCE